MAAASHGSKAGGGTEQRRGSHGSRPVAVAHGGGKSRPPRAGWPVSHGGCVVTGSKAAGSKAGGSKANGSSEMTAIKTVNTKLG